MFNNNRPYITETLNIIHCSCNRPQSPRGNFYSQQVPQSFPNNNNLQQYHQLLQPQVQNHQVTYPQIPNLQEQYLLSQYQSEALHNLHQQPLNPQAIQELNQYPQPNQYYQLAQFPAMQMNEPSQSSHYGNVGLNNIDHKTALDYQIALMEFNKHCMETILLQEQNKRIHSKSENFNNKHSFANNKKSQCSLRKRSCSCSIENHLDLDQSDRIGLNESNNVLDGTSYDELNVLNKKHDERDGNKKIVGEEKKKRRGKSAGIQTSNKNKENELTKKDSLILYKELLDDLITQYLEATGSSKKRRPSKKIGKHSESNLSPRVSLYSADVNENKSKSVENETTRKHNYLKKRSSRKNNEYTDLSPRVSLYSVDVNENKSKSEENVLQKHSTTGPATRDDFEQLQSLECINSTCNNNLNCPGKEYGLKQNKGNKQSFTQDTKPSSRQRMSNTSIKKDCKSNSVVRGDFNQHSYVNCPGKSPCKVDHRFKPNNSDVKTTKVVDDVNAIQKKNTCKYNGDEELYKEDTKKNIEEREKICTNCPSKEDNLKKVSKPKIESNSNQFDKSPQQRAFNISKKNDPRSKSIRSKDDNFRRSDKPKIESKDSNSIQFERSSQQCVTNISNSEITNGSGCRFNCPGIEDNLKRCNTPKSSNRENSKQIKDVNAGRSKTPRNEDILQENIKTNACEKSDCKSNCLGKEDNFNNTSTTNNRENSKQIKGVTTRTGRSKTTSKEDNLPGNNKSNNQTELDGEPTVIATETSDGGFKCPDKEDGLKRDNTPKSNNGEKTKRIKVMNPRTVRSKSPSKKGIPQGNSKPESNNADLINTELFENAKASERSYGGCKSSCQGKEDNLTRGITPKSSNRQKTKSGNASGKIGRSKRSRDEANLEGSIKPKSNTNSTEIKNVNASEMSDNGCKSNCASKEDYLKSGRKLETNDTHLINRATHGPDRKVFDVNASENSCKCPIEEDNLDGNNTDMGGKINASETSLLCTNYSCSCPGKKDDFKEAIKRKEYNMNVESKFKYLKLIEKESTDGLGSSGCNINDCKINRKREENREYRYNEINKPIICIMSMTRDNDFRLDRLNSSVQNFVTNASKEDDASFQSALNYTSSKLKYSDLTLSSNDDKSLELEVETNVLYFCDKNLSVPEINHKNSSRKISSPEVDKNCARKLSGNIFKKSKIPIRNHTLLRKNSRMKEEKSRLIADLCRNVDSIQKNPLPTDAIEENVRMNILQCENKKELSILNYKNNNKDKKKNDANLEMEETTCIKPVYHYYEEALSDRPGSSREPDNEPKIIDKQTYENSKKWRSKISGRENLIEEDILKRSGKFKLDFLRRVLKVDGNSPNLTKLEKYANVNKKSVITERKRNDENIQQRNNMDLEKTDKLKIIELDDKLKKTSDKLSKLYNDKNQKLDDILDGLLEILD